MNAKDLSPLLASPPCDEGEDSALPSLLMQPPVQSGGATPGVAIGELLAVVDGRIAVVRIAGREADGALEAPTAIDLHGGHIGARVVLAFEGGDPARPVVLGVLRGHPGWPLPETPAQVEVDADGQRMVVHARQQLVLRCGKASITLTREGKVLIEGAYVLSRSTGVNRIKGGSVQLN